MGDLATWAYENRPGWMKADEIQDVLAALISFLLRIARQHNLPIRSLPAVLIAIAHRQRCQRFRDKVYEERERFAAQPAVEPTPLAHIERLEQRASLRDALAILSKPERDALIRKHVHRESYRQIAMSLYGRAGRREEGRISVMLTRARQKLRAELGAEFMR
jgi:RNA polymerase sigma factor (sigma-70 family)